MELMWILALLFVGLLLIYSVVVKNSKLISTGHFLLSVLLVLIIGAISSSIVLGNFVYIASTTMALSFIASGLSIMKNWWAKLSVLLIAFITIILLADPMIHGEYEIVFTERSALILLVFSMIAPFVMNKKISLFQKWFGATENGLQASLELFMIGFLFFVSNFLFSAPGIVLTAAGFTIGSNLLDERFKRTSIALLMLGLFYPFMESAGLTEIDLSLGKVMMGLFFGAFLTVFVSAFASDKITRPWFIVFPILILFGVSAFIVFLGTQKADLGGFDAFLGLMIGSAIAIIVIPGSYSAGLVVSFIVLSGLVMKPSSDPEEVKKSVVQQPEKSEQVQGLFDQAVNVPLNELAGTFEIDNSTFKLSFELGPRGGRTKGAFKDVKGTVVLSADMNQSSFSVNLPVISLTTFNKFRDESLMSKEYFDQQKFGTMYFSSRGVVVEKDRLLLNGKFNMLGVEKEQSVELKYLGEKDGAPVFIGRGVIDRRDFGMKSDPKEGNVVDFEFEIRLNKK